MRVTAKVIIHDSAEVEKIAEALDVAGLWFDEDYTTLYGAAWQLTGIEVFNAKALIALGKILGTEVSR